MSRAQRVGLYFGLTTVVYILALYQILPIPFVDAKVADEILPMMPWWCLVTAGSYSLWSLGWGLFAFRECPEAYTELLEQITQAKNDLRSKGVMVD